MPMSRTLVVLMCFCLGSFLMGCSQTENRTETAPGASSTPAPIAASSPAASSEAAEPPADVVQASAQEVELPAGGAAQAVVRIKIAGGYHINGNPASKYQIATSLSVEPGQGVTAGKTIYPPSVSKRFSFSNEPITVYEGEAVIKQPLRAESSASKGSQTLKGKLKVQPCDEHVCYPPLTLDISIPVNVK